VTAPLFQFVLARSGITYTRRRLLLYLNTDPDEKEWEKKNKEDKEQSQ